MTDTLTISPIWRYVADNFSEDTISGIHLMIWSGGFSMAAFNGENTPLMVQTYLTRKRPDHLWMKELIRQDGFLKRHARKVSKVWLSEERNLLVPHDIYEENDAESWLRKFHYLSPDESLLHFNLEGVLGANILFPISEDLKVFLTYEFPKAVFAPLSRQAFLPDEKESPVGAQMVCLPREVILTLSHNGQFIYHLVYPYESPQNIIYKIALVLEEKGMSQEQVTAIRFSGIAPFWNNIIHELSPYFSLSVPSQDTTEMTLQFLKDLCSCA